MLYLGKILNIIKVFNLAKELTILVFDLIRCFVKHLKLFSIKQYIPSIISSERIIF